MNRLICLFLVFLSLQMVNGQTAKTLADSVKSATKSRNVKKMFSTVKGAFNLKSAQADELVGRWAYVEPVVLSTSGNLLARMAGNTFSDDLRKLIDDYFERANVTPTNTTLVFRKNGTFSRSVAGQATTGVWMVDGGYVRLAEKNVQTSCMNTHIEQDTLALVVDADKILEALQSLGGISDSKSKKALVKMSKYLTGMKGGFLMVRRKK